MREYAPASASSNSAPGSIGERGGELIEMYTGQVVHGGADLTGVQAGAGPQRPRASPPRRGARRSSGGALEDVGGLDDVRAAADRPAG